MTEKKRPTNADIYTALGAIQNDLKAIHKQVRETNGRVTALEKREYGRTLIEEFVEKEGIKTPAQKADGWTTREKTLTAIITSLIAIVAAMAGVSAL